MGLTQHRTGVENVRMVVNLLLASATSASPAAGASAQAPPTRKASAQKAQHLEKPELVRPTPKEEDGFEPPRWTAWSRSRPAKVIFMAR